MTAGRGIIHSEMPQQKDGLMWGFQLWVNLPAREKLREPRYQDIPPERIPEAKRPDGTRIHVIAGEADGVRGAVDGIATDNGWYWALSGTWVPTAAYAARIVAEPEPRDRLAARGMRLPPA